MRSKVLWKAPLALLFYLAPAGRADTIKSFDLIASTQSRAVTGDLTIDITTGVVQAASLAYLGLTYDVLNNQGFDPALNAYQVEVPKASATLPAFELYIPGSSLVDYVGGSVCSISTPCSYGSVSEFVTPGTPPRGFPFAFGELIDSSLVGSTVTPEPASLTLMGTGLLSLVGVGWARRKRVSVC